MAMERQMANIKKIKKPEKMESVTSRIAVSKVGLSAAEQFAQRPKIQSLIRQIAVDANDRSSKIIKAADGIRALRAEFEANRSSIGMTWYEWVRKFGYIPDKNVAALLTRIANAETQKEKEAILRIFWRGNNDRQKEARARKKSAYLRMSKTRRKLFDWSQDAPDDQVEKIWAHVGLTFTS
jgi:hypothetical protein